MDARDGNIKRRSWNGEATLPLAVIVMGYRVTETVCGKCTTAGAKLT